MNKMTAANLAVVFGPNLAWPNDKVNYLNFSQVLLSIKSYFRRCHFNILDTSTLSHNFLLITCMKYSSYRERRGLLPAQYRDIKEKNAFD